MAIQEVWGRGAELSAVAECSGLQQTTPGCSEVLRITEGVLRVTARALPPTQRHLPESPNAKPHYIPRNNPA